VDHALEALVLMGDCTDICVSDLAVALLSARNHGMLTAARPEEREAFVRAVTSMPIHVYVPGCATYDLDPPQEMAEDRRHLRHPGAGGAPRGLWIMQTRGAQLIDGWGDVDGRLPGCPCPCTGPGVCASFR